MTHPHRSRPSAVGTSAVSPVLAAGAVLALVLTSCGASDEDTAQSERAGGDRLVTSAEAGMERASSFGFDSAGFFTEDAVQEFRTQMEDSMAEGADDAEVDPAECAEPLAAVDWAPLLLGTDAARVDFGSETFTGTGSIEVASVSDGEDSERVDEHFDHVRTLVESCPELEFSRHGSDYDLEVSEVELDQLEAAESGHQGTIAYSWTRGFEGEDQDAVEDGDQEGEADEVPEGAPDDEAHRGGGGTIVAQILFTRMDDDVVMVSFIGETAAGSSEFTEMAESITDHTLDSLEETR
ncbi:MAG: hypothetical protein Q4F53_03375 [Nesterenkonia sp.]|nr:hypothetical protein [Nesterenkonia sp.]